MILNRLKSREHCLKMEEVILQHFLGVKRGIFLSIFSGNFKSHYFEVGDRSLRFQIFNYLESSSIALHNLSRIVEYDDRKRQFRFPKSLESHWIGIKEPIQNWYLIIDQSDNYRLKGDNIYFSQRINGREIVYLSHNLDNYGKDLCSFENEVFCRLGISSDDKINFEEVNRFGTGTTTTFYDNGQKMMLESYVNYKRKGLSIKWTENGKLEETMEWQNDEMEGMRKRYFRDIEKIQFIHYFHQSRIVRMEKYDRNGNLLYERVI